MIQLNSHEAFTKRYVFNPVQDEIGHGGFGTIYKAVDAARKRTVAIKRAAKQKNTNVTLEQEFKLCNELRHPNIISYENHYQFSTDMGIYEYIVMPYFEAGNLETVLSKYELSLAEKHQIILDILSGLQYLHQEQFIHRDLKPENILMKRVADKWIPVITDFGISKLMDVSASVIEVSQNIISLSYATPEQLMGQRVVRRNIDLWPIGVLLYRMLTNELPFTSKSEPLGNSTYWEVSKKIRDCQLPAQCYSLPEPYQQVILVCLQTDPIKRVQSAEALITRLGAHPPAGLLQNGGLDDADDGVPMGILLPNDAGDAPLVNTEQNQPKPAFGDQTQEELPFPPSPFQEPMRDQTQHTFSSLPPQQAPESTYITRNLNPERVQQPVDQTIVNTWMPQTAPTLSDIVSDLKNGFIALVNVLKYILYVLAIFVGSIGLCKMIGL